MLDVERVVTLDDLVELVPEALIREAEQNRLASEEIIDDSPHSRTKEPRIVAKELSKAQRIRAHLEQNPGARNRDIVASLKQYKVTAADVANVKSLMKRSAAKQSAKGAHESERPVVSSPSTALVTVGANVSLPELEAGVAFIKAAGSLTRAKHVLIIIEQIKDNVK